MTGLAGEELLARRRKLEERILKLRALGTSPEPEEAATAHRLADQLEKELEALPRPPEPPRMVLDPHPLVVGAAFTPVTHRYFQAAEFAARRSGLLLHVTAELWVIPKAQLYGPKKRFAGAAKVFASVQKDLDARAQAWVQRQGQTVASAVLDEYAKGFLLGLEARFDSKESARARAERLTRLSQVKEAYERERRGR